ncbi:hypothetical protein JCGZ_01324 [Jatropha curcas]|uniref:C2 domain-containing protein n=1 Tax=Jatropha curcas TaxID=180498 RepID=A0A067LKH5_JATCU|nr:uncharacterized protein LOC105649129 [Jatropha curcas]KDP44824.1 hypothetical protein JCGZ_01324 [Jatropha curcas]
MGSKRSNSKEEIVRSRCNKVSIGRNFEVNYSSGIEKEKRMNEDDNGIALILSIFHAEGIHNLRTNPFVTHGIYKVESWVEIGNPCVTLEVSGSANPVWNQRFCIPLENPMDCKVLHLEVIRTYSRSDPGTSTGEVLVGKMQLPLPKLSTKIQGLFGFVKPEGIGYKVAGGIYLSMELTKIKKYKYFV